MVRRVFARGLGTSPLPLVLVMLALRLTVPVAAQAPSGVVSGAIVDGQGGVLPGVALTLRNVETGVVRATVSESDGQYRFSALQPGRYGLTAVLPGFATVEVTDITLTIGMQLKQDLKMTIEALQETITVSGLAPVIDTAKHEVASVITQEQIETLPIEGRQAVSLALLMPGTGGDNVTPRRANTNVGAGGLSHFSTNYLVDGTMNMSTESGDPRMDFPQSAIQEFKVTVTQAPAEYGGRTGGIVTVATKSGTNRFSGEAYEFFRDKSLNAMNRFETEQHERFGAPKPEFRRHLYGGALGGPLIKNKLHFFLAAERSDPRQFVTVNTGQPQFYGTLEGSILTGTKSTVFFSRGDLQINPDQSLFVRWARQSADVICQDCGGSVAAAGGDDIYLPRDSFVVGHTWVLSSRAVNEIRFMRGGQSHIQGPHGQPLWRNVGEFPPARFQGITPVFTFPSMTWGNAQFHIDLQWIYQFRNDLSLTFDAAGTHTLKLGVGFESWPQEEDVEGNPVGAWTFAADQPFDGTAASIANLRNPIQFTGSFPPLFKQQFHHIYQGYIQDEWRPRHDLTLSLGIRYDVDTKVWREDADMGIYPRPLPFTDFSTRGDRNNFAPRLGFAWDTRDDGRSVLRGGYGIVYHNVLNGWFGPEHTTLRQTSINIRNPTYPDPYQGRDPLTFASTAPPNIQIADDDLRNPAARTGSVGFSQELGRNMAIHVDGVYTETDEFPTNVNVNTPDPVTRLRPDPTWGRIVQLQSAGTARYKAMFVRLDRRFAGRHQYMVSYTLAKTENNWQGGTSTGSVTDFYTPDLDWGPGNTDRRHSVVASGAVLLPWDVTFGGVWTYRSTMPFTARAGRDLNQDGANTDYVPGTARNQGNRNLDLAAVNAYRAANDLGAVPESQIDTNELNRLDVRASKSFSLGANRKLELIGQLFNVLGTDNLGALGSGWVVNALSNSFGRVLTAQPRQQAELALRIVW
ncbi:MAG: TonB-dependent receptor [Vicinamibacterales bacterium]